MCGFSRQMLTCLDFTVFPTIFQPNQRLSSNNFQMHCMLLCPKSSTFGLQFTCYVVSLDFRMCFRRFFFNLILSIIRELVQQPKILCQVLAVHICRQYSSYHRWLLATPDLLSCYIVDSNENFPVIDPNQKTITGQLSIIIIVDIINFQIIIYVHTFYDASIYIFLD